MSLKAELGHEYERRKLVSLSLARVLQCIVSEKKAIFEGRVIAVQ